MYININLDECELLTDISTVYSKYYKLPIRINECDILHREYNPITEEFIGFSLCFIYYNSKFPSICYWLHCADTQERYGYIRIDSELVNTWRDELEKQNVIN